MENKNTVNESTVHIMFTTLLYTFNLEKHKKLNQHFYKTILNLQKKHKLKKPGMHDWNCNTFSSLNLYDLVNDKNFQILYEDILVHLKFFADMFGATLLNNINVHSAWINLTKPGSFQENHNHANSHFSFVYYVKVPPNSGNIIFESFENFNDMFPVPVQKMTPPSFKYYHYVPKECDLLIFRSNLRHMVNLNSSNEDRVSISGNLILK